MAVTVQCSLCLFIFYRKIKFAWWSQVIAFAVPHWVGGRKVETMLKTADASVIWKYPRSALQQSLIFRSCHSQDGSRAWLSLEPPTQGWQIWCWTYGNRKGWVVLGHLGASRASCWPHGRSVSLLVLAGTPQGIPSTPSWVLWLLPPLQLLPMNFLLRWLHVSKGNSNDFKIAFVLSIYFLSNSWASVR